MRLLSIISLPALMVVQACSSHSIASAAFPDRQAYKVYSKVLEEELVYHCKPGATDTETQARVNKANKMFETYVEAEGGKLIEQMLSTDTFSRSDAVAASKKLDAAAETMVARMDAELQCLPVEL